MGGGGGNGTGFSETRGFLNARYHSLTSQNSHGLRLRSLSSWVFSPRGENFSFTKTELHFSPVKESRNADPLSAAAVGDRQRLHYISGPTQRNATHSSGGPSHCPPPAAPRCPRTASASITPTCKEPHYHSHAHLGEALIKHTLGGPAPREGAEAPTPAALNRGDVAPRDALMGTGGWGSERPFPALLIPRSPWLSPPSADGPADFSVTADTSVPQHRRVRCSQRALGAHTSGDGSVQPHTAGQRCVSRSPPTPGSAAIFSGRRRFSAQIPSRLKAAGQSSALCLQQTERTAETRRGGARGRRSCGRLTNKQPTNRFETTVGGQIAVFSPERPTSGGVKEGDGAERRRRWVRAARGCDRGQLRSVGSENGPGWKGPVRTTEPFCQRCFFHPPTPPRRPNRGAHSRRSPNERHRAAPPHRRPPLPTSAVHTLSPAPPPGGAAPAPPPAPSSPCRRLQ